MRGPATVAQKTGAANAAVPTKHAEERNLDMVAERRLTPAVVAGIVAGLVALVVAAAAGANAATSSPGARQAPVASSPNGTRMDYSPNMLPIDPD